MEKARAMLVSSLISANMLFVTPMLPFRAPARNRLFVDENIAAAAQARLYLPQR
jgi:hypothetical protein